MDTEKQHFYLETFGCQMNKGDSELMRKSLVDAGFIESTGIDKSSIAIYNTCSVRDHAEQRALAIITANNKVIRKKKGITVIAGCMAQKLGAQLVVTGVADIIVGPYQSPEIGSILAMYLSDPSKSVYLSQERDELAGRLPLEYAQALPSNSWHEWVTISHGCDNWCSYCIVPRVRGKLISFPSDIILTFLHVLSERGIHEITLLGQNVNQYGSDTNDIPLYKLLEKAAQIQGFERINFITSHPKDFSEDIVHVIRDNGNISRSIHLPLQSGSDRILTAMNRKYTMRDYYLIVDVLQRHLDSFALSTDLIVGFPGETHDEYLATLKAVETIHFDEAFTYAYSPREGTAAYSVPETCTKEEKKERLIKLIQIQRKIANDKLHSRINTVDNTIVERISKKSSKVVMGKTSLNHPVVLPGDETDIGKKIKIKILGIVGSTLQGTRIA